MFLNNSSSRQGLGSHSGAGLILYMQGQHKGSYATRHLTGRDPPQGKPEVSTGSKAEAQPAPARCWTAQLPLVCSSQDPPPDDSCHQGSPSCGSQSCLGNCLSLGKHFHKNCEGDKHWPRRAQYFKIGKKLNLFNLPLSFSKGGHIQGQTKSMPGAGQLVNCGLLTTFYACLPRRAPHISSRHY